MQHVPAGGNFRRAVARIGVGERADALHGIGDVGDAGVGAVVFVIFAAHGETDAVARRNDDAGRPDLDVELDIEIWPTCIVVPPGHRIGHTVRGKDYEYDGTDAGIANVAYPMKGVGPFTHTDPRDRPPEISAGRNVLHFSSGRMPHLLLPIIPP